MKRLCRELQQRYWDGGLSADDTDFQSHRDECSECREWHLRAEGMEEALRFSPPPSPSADLTARIVDRVLAERRAARRPLLRWRAAAALAASVLVMFWISRQTPTPQTSLVVEAHPGPDALATLQEHIVEASTAVADLTRRTADGTLEETRSLLPARPPAPVLPGADAFESSFTPPARALQEAGHYVVVGLDPVTSSARRAFNLFRREVSTGEPAGETGL
jgi:hypothetical protein